jgi:Fe-S cluster assembly iron-binding protein IscA
MLTLTPAAQRQLDLHFEGKPKETIRVYLAAGCGGPRLALALDDAKSGDVTLDAGGYSFLMEQGLYDAAKPVEIDFSDAWGFVVNSSMAMPAGGGCSSCGGGCGH